ncbi:Predicted transcriptional regulators, partial [Pseudomonas fluorescens]
DKPPRRAIARKTSESRPDTGAACRAGGTDAIQSHRGGERHPFCRHDRLRARFGCSRLRTCGGSSNDANPRRAWGFIRM